MPNGPNGFEKDLPTALSHFMQQIPKTQDLILIILRGHLLVERVIDAILRAAVPNPGLIEPLRLSFPQKITLARALSRGQASDPAWEFALSIHHLRARLITTDVSREIDHLGSVVLSRSRQVAVRVGLPPSFGGDTPDDFRYATALAAAYFATINRN